MKVDEKRDIKRKLNVWAEANRYKKHNQVIKIRCLMAVSWLIMKYQDTKITMIGIFFDDFQQGGERTSVCIELLFYLEMDSFAWDY